MKATYLVYDTSPFEAMSIHQMLEQFHTKFGLAYDGPKRNLTSAELAFRLECHREEAKEYADATDLEDMLDGLADELIFLAGTAHRMGLHFEKLNIVGEQVLYDGPPRMLSPAERALRLQLHSSAVTRFETVAATGDLDLQYRALALALHAFTATALLHGFDIDEAVRRVHAANMAKNVDPAKQRRRALLKEQGHDVEHMMEITKPDDWLPPYLGDLVGKGPYKPHVPEGSVPMFIHGEEVYIDTASICGLITIDGPDASGKTTLAKRIVEVTGGQYIHLTWSPQLARVMHNYRAHAIAYAQALAEHCVVVLERPWMSHPVYSNVYRAGEYDMEQVIHWKTMTEGAAALNLFALPSDNAAWLENYTRMCQTRKELHGPDLENASAVYENFVALFQGAEPVLMPQGVVEVYDMHHSSTLDIDLYISQFVLPHLKAKV